MAGGVAPADMVWTAVAFTLLFGKKQQKDWRTEMLIEAGIMRNCYTNDGSAKFVSRT